MNEPKIVRLDQSELDPTMRALCQLEFLMAAIIEDDPTDQLLERVDDLREAILAIDAESD